jgi:hypothetical protein
MACRLKKLVLKLCIEVMYVSKTCMEVMYASKDLY